VIRMKESWNGVWLGWLWRIAVRFIGGRG